MFIVWLRFVNHLLNYYYYYLLTYLLTYLQYHDVMDVETENGKTMSRSKGYLL